MRSAPILLLAAALALPACAQEAEEPSQTRQQASESAPEQGLDPSFDPTSERAIKKQWQARTPGKRVSEIDWAAARQHRQVAPTKLDDEQLARLVDSPVPALLPERPELLDGATVTGGEHWYAVSLDGDAHSVYVSGTRLVTVVEGLEVVDEQPELEDDFRITRVDAIVSLSVNAFGAAYTIEVECARPTTDARCVEDDYVVSLANALVLPKAQAGQNGGLQ
jgi:hypothetical protein